MSPLNKTLSLILTLCSGIALTAETVLLDFGNDDSFRGISVSNPDENGNYWNSVRSGAYFGSLVDIENNASGIQYGPGAHPTDSYNGPAGATDGGITEVMLLTLNIDKTALGRLGVPEAAIDYHAGKLGESSGYFVLNGLNAAATYTLRFFGSHKYNEHDTTRINIYDDSDRLNLIATEDFVVGIGGAHNQDTVVEFVELIPSAGGQLYLEFGGADGASFGYLNAMEVSTESGGTVEPGPDPEPDEGIKLVVAGSSVPVGGIILGGPTYYHDFDEDKDDTGWGGTENSFSIYGYAGRLRESLTQPVNPRVPGGSTTEWEFVNVSVPGNNTTLLRQRFETDVTRQYPAPVTSHAEPQYVMLGLSMANEGLVHTTDSDSIFASFRDGMLELIEACQARGYYPLITLVYPHEDYTPEKYEYVQAMNLLMNTWGVAAINLLGAIDNGHGQWADGFFADAGHPNFIGHAELYYAIPPTLFAAIHHDGKRTVPVYPQGEGGLTMQSEAWLEFTTADTMHSYNSSFRFRATQPGTLATVKGATKTLALIDFGPATVEDGTPTEAPDRNGNHWNNWHPLEGGVTIPAGTALGSVVDVDGQATDIQIEVMTAFTGANGKRNGGLLEPDRALLEKFAVATATEDYFYTTSTAALKITGLDPSQHYTFRLFGTRAASDARSTRFRVTGTTADFNYSPYADIVTSGSGVSADGNSDGNDSAIGLISNIRPRANGEIFVEVLPSAGGFAYLGAMEILVGSDAGAVDRIEVREGALAYVTADGRQIVAAGNYLDGQWHDIALTHRFAQQESLLYVNGAAVGQLRQHREPLTFTLGIAAGSELPPAPAQVDIMNWAVHRAAWTEAEATAQAQGNLQHASLEILAPLKEESFTDGHAVENHAQTRSEVLFHGPAIAEPLSYWHAVPPDVSTGAKLTGIGWIDDADWPFVYHYSSGDWFFLSQQFSESKDDFFAFSIQTLDWIWSSDLYGGWYYDYGLNQWLTF